MKKFKFRLQKVMDIREETERQRMLALADSKQHMLREEHLLKQCKNHLEDCLIHIDKLQSAGRMAPGELQMQYKYLQKLKHDIERQKIALAVARQAMEKKRLELLEASQDRKVMDNLKARRYTSYIAETEKSEQAIMDDLSINRYAAGRQELNGFS